MRKTIAVGITAMLAMSAFTALPAQATHCNESNATSCPNPLVILVVEGIGNVCNKANVVNTTAYGAKCTYLASDAVWDRTKAASTWNQTGYTTGSAYQGLFWPGVGPGAIGPYRLNVGASANPPANACVDSIGGPGCKTDTEGKLTVGVVKDANGNNLQSVLGAYCGASQGKGVFKYTSAPPAAGGPVQIDEGNLGWDQSAATILPNYGTVLKHNGVALPVGKRPTIRGFNSSRGIGGSGNCGVTAPTTGFQVEGFLITF